MLVLPYQAQVTRLVLDVETLSDYTRDFMRIV